MAFPDYTLWGLPGKLKPWTQLRLDLLHRAQTPWAGKQVILWLYYGHTMTCCGFTIALLWLYYGFAMALLWHTMASL